VPEEAIEWTNEQWITEWTNEQWITEWTNEQWITEAKHTNYRLNHIRHKLLFVTVT